MSLEVALRGGDIDGDEGGRGGLEFAARGPAGRRGLGIMVGGTLVLSVSSIINVP